MSNWKIDKHINISVIVAVAIQCICLVWWLSSIDHTTVDHTERIAKLEKWREDRTEKDMNIAERLARTEGKVSDLKDQVSRVEDKLDEALQYIYKQQ